MFWDFVEFIDLPSTMQELANTIGLNATLALLREFHGQNIYIPCKFSESHRIATIAGSSSLRLLIEDQGGLYLDFPRCVAAQTKGQIRELVSKGVKSRKAIARECHKSVTHISNCLAEMDFAV